MLSVKVVFFCFPLLPESHRNTTPKGGARQCARTVRLGKLTGRSCIQRIRQVIHVPENVRGQHLALATRRRFLGTLKRALFPCSFGFSGKKRRFFPRESACTCPSESERSAGRQWQAERRRREMASALRLHDWLEVREKANEQKPHKFTTNQLRQTGK